MITVNAKITAANLCLLLTWLINPYKDISVNTAMKMAISQG